MATHSLSKDEVKHVWQQVCNDLQPQLTDATFNTWILNNPLTELNYEDNNQAFGIISAQSAFHAVNLKKQVYSYLKYSLEKITGKTISLDFKISSFPTVSSSKKKSRFHETKGSGLKTVAQIMPGQNFNHLAGSPQNQLQSPSAPQMESANSATSQDVITQPNNPDLTHQNLAQPNNFYSQAGQNNSANQQAQYQKFTHPENRQSLSPTVEELFSTKNIQIAAKDRALIAARRIGLRPDYTFESFAVSSSNEMAHAAASAVSKRPGIAYNPLFLYGSVGVGKTHLMHAIGHNILKQNPDTDIRYCSGEEFTNEIIRAIQNKKAIVFKEKYRNAQVLFIDDVQFIAGKNTVQEEFFHTFNALIQKGSQIILTSDRPPHEIPLLEDRLRSRFEAGLMIDIQQPSLELRSAIVLIKARANNLILPIDLAQQIASKVNSARKIEGVITMIRSEVELKRRPISPKLIEEVLNKEKANNKFQVLRIRPTELIKKVATFYQMQPAVIRGKKRTKDIVLARHIAMYILKKDVRLSYVEIGKWFSNRDHTSVMHAISKIDTLINEDDLLNDEINQIKRKLR